LKMGATHLINTLGASRIRGVNVDFGLSGFHREFDYAVSIAW